VLLLLLLPLPLLLLLLLVLSLCCRQCLFAEHSRICCLSRVWWRTPVFSKTLLHHHSSNSHEDKTVRL